MIVFLGILCIAWPVIAFPIFIGVAVQRKWWPHDKLSIISGGAGILMGIYYAFLFGFRFNKLTNGWPIILGCILLSGWVGWYMMKNFVIVAEQRQLEKDLKQQKDNCS